VRCRWLRIRRSGWRTCPAVRSCCDERASTAYRLWRPCPLIDRLS
jgi:hypothetical protein